MLRGCIDLMSSPALAGEEGDPSPQAMGEVRASQNSRLTLTYPASQGLGGPLSSRENSNALVIAHETCALRSGDVSSPSTSHEHFLAAWCAHGVLVVSPARAGEDKL